MKSKAILLLTLFTLLFTVPCYAEAPGAMEGMILVFFLMVIIGGAILGFLVKVVLYYLRIESARNWQIFLGSTITAGLILYVMLRGA